MRVRGDDYGGAWVPVFTAERERKGEETFWPVGLDMRHLYCIVCPAGSPVPQVRALSCWGPYLGPGMSSSDCIASTAQPWTLFATVFCYEGSKRAWLALQHDC